MQLTEGEQSCGWFQNDLSASHTTAHSLTALEDVFGDNKKLCLWPAKLHLVLCDLYVWGNLKVGLPDGRGVKEKCMKRYFRTYIGESWCGDYIMGWTIQVSNPGEARDFSCL